MDAPSDEYCVNHPAIEADKVCFECLKPLCDRCAHPMGANVTCRACLQKTDHTAGMKLVLIVAILVVVLGVGIAAAVWFWGPRNPEAEEKAGFDYGTNTALVKELEGYLVEKPCDRAKTHMLVETVLESGDYQGVVERSEAFFEHCGEFSELLWLTYAAHKHLEEWEAAVADAGKLIEDDPTDHDFRWWRGIVYEQMGELDKAAADYEAALQLTPGLDGIPFNLADIYEKQGRYCEAVVPLESFLTHNPDVDWDTADSIRERSEALRELGQCPAPLPVEPIEDELEGIPEEPPLE